MLFGDKEIDLVYSFQSAAETDDILILPRMSKKVKFIINSIILENNWKEWIDSSASNDPPPDFYSDKFHLMMDVMRVDDHERKGRKGKLFNPYKSHERDLYHEIKNKSHFDESSNVNIVINGITDLPSYQDHNYIFYKNNFKRVVQNHINSIPIYKNNHPGFKTIFLIYDESSAYYQAPYDIEPKRQRIAGEITRGDLHRYYLDSAFLNVFLNCHIDYIIWFTPYKLYNICQPVPKKMLIPSISVFDISKKHFMQKKYNEKRMESLEI